MTKSRISWTHAVLVCFFLQHFNSLNLFVFDPIFSDPFPSVHPLLVFVSFLVSLSEQMLCAFLHFSRLQLCGFLYLFKRVCLSVRQSVTHEFLRN